MAKLRFNFFPVVMRRLEPIYNFGRRAFPITLGLGLTGGTAYALYKLYEYNKYLHEKEKSNILRKAEEKFQEVITSPESRDYVKKINEKIIPDKKNEVDYQKMVLGSILGASTLGALNFMRGGFNSTTPATMLLGGGLGALAGYNPDLWLYPSLGFGLGYSAGQVFNTSGISPLTLGLTGGLAGMFGQSLIRQ